MTGPKTPLPERESMTVKELMEVLSKYSPKCKVYLSEPGHLIVRSTTGPTNKILSLVLGEVDE